MWKLSIEDDQANKTVVHLVRDDYGLGRAEENAVRLTERNISRRHARLERREDAWVLRDVTSYNGCYVNGQRVVEAQELAHGDLIQVGDYRLVMENEALLAAAENTATVPVPRLAAASASVDRLVMLVGPTPGAEFVLTPGRMLVGRGEDCDISINHASVSRIHSELYPIGDGRYEILDKNSANGVRVNGVELPRTFVDARDVIELGDVILKFIPAGDTYLPGADESLQLAAMGSAREQEASESINPRPSRFAWLKILLGGGGLLAITIALVMVLGRRDAPAELANMKDEATAKAERTLSDASKLLAAGDPRGAFERAAELPTDAPARAGNEFRKIQSAYADALFQQADSAADLADKRSLYDQIARSPSVDGGRRSKAAQLLAGLSEQALAVTDLPNATPPPSARPIAVAPSASVSAASPAAEPSTRPANVEPTALPTIRKPAPVASFEDADDSAAAKPTSPPAARSAKPQLAPVKSSSLSRENPY